MSGTSIIAQIFTSLSIMLATGCQNLGRLNRKLSEVLYLLDSVLSRCSTHVDNDCDGFIDEGERTD